jgi:hypothetical protein
MKRVTLAKQAAETLDWLRQRNVTKYKKVRKALQHMSEDLHHPGLQTHEFYSKRGPKGEKVFEAYAENDTSNAYRVLWCYGPGEDEISVLAIVPHD